MLKLSYKVKVIKLKNFGNYKLCLDIKRVYDLVCSLSLEFWCPKYNVWKYLFLALEKCYYMILIELLKSLN